MSTDTPSSPRERALRHVAARSTGGPLDARLRLTVNFHPDRTTGGRPILRAMAEDGVYLSQFVTGTSNGGLTARPGGDRWSWESRIFGGAYDRAAPHERPVYGALNFRGRSVGAAPRFGSAHFRLTAETLGRATFCYPDSAAEPTVFGVADRCSPLESAEADDPDALDDYVEAHVHGPVRFDRDVEALVLDPSHRGTDVEAAARELPCPVEWHGGFRLTVEELRRHPDYRGPQYVELGAEIAVDGLLDPRIVGDAVRTGRHDPQALKRVWHCLARFGPPTPYRAARVAVAPAVHDGV
ncbi:DUF3626 domain-containing protein [Streptomyces megasporus]|uniref:DUF3626 domain-containing protein n=1 Tax=Streptomyces megasporus TaxID=44060 RepID=UPI00068DF3E6|nr:DUF3626 domain-containing protein [Streptomyces megasporus]